MEILLRVTWQMRINVLEKPETFTFTVEIGKLHVSPKRRHPFFNNLEILIIYLVSLHFTVSEAIHQLTLGYHGIASPFLLTDYISFNVGTHFYKLHGVTNQNFITLLFAITGTFHAGSCCFEVLTRQAMYI
jgi:hypothetical protein